MKPISIAAASALLLCALCGCATSKTNTSAVNGQTQQVTLTGSYLKQPITRAGLITDGSSQVLVIDREMIQRSGASDVRQVLNRYGYPNRN